MQAILHSRFLRLTHWFVHRNSACRSRTSRWDACTGPTRRGGIRCEAKAQRSCVLARSKLLLLWISPLIAENVSIHEAPSAAMPGARHALEHGSVGMVPGGHLAWELQAADISRLEKTEPWRRTHMSKSSRNESGGLPRKIQQRLTDWFSSSDSFKSESGKEKRHVTAEADAATYGACHCKSQQGN